MRVCIATLRNRCLCPDYFSPSLRGQRNRAPRSGALGPGDVAGNPPAAIDRCAATNRVLLPTGLCLPTQLLLSAVVLYEFVLLRLHSPACGMCPCGPFGCGTSYRVGPATEVVWKALKSEEFARNGLPRTMTKVVFAPAFRATDQTAGIFHASTRPQNRAESRRDLGAVESRITRTAQRLPLSMSDGIDRY